MTSNKDKLGEYIRLGLDADMSGTSVDVDEPDTTGDVVALHKAMAAGPYSIVEDTSLEIEGAQVGANVRWLMDSLGMFHGQKAVFKVYLARHDGLKVDVYEGIVHGVIDANKPREVGFGFDPVFVPEGGGGFSLGELEAMNQKDAFSARHRACDALNANTPVLTQAVADIKPWAGAWQTSEITL